MDFGSFLFYSIPGNVSHFKCMLEIFDDGITGDKPSLIYMRIFYIYDGLQILDLYNSLVYCISGLILRYKYDNLTRLMILKLSLL